jgi:hypothetical protein
MQIHSIELFLPFFPDPLENTAYLQSLFDEYALNLKIKEIKYNAGAKRDKMIYIYNDTYMGEVIPVGIARGVLVNYFIN